MTTLKKKYNIIPLRDYVNLKKSGSIDKLPPRSMIISIDDGYKENFLLRDALKKHDIPITIFLCTGIVGTNKHFWFEHDIKNYDIEYLKKLTDEERVKILSELGFEETAEHQDRQALSESEIDEMKSYVDFQSHTVTHPILPLCDYEKSFFEISGSKIVLEQKFGQKTYAISYPNGGYSNRDIKIAKQSGYECGLTTETGLNSYETDLFRLKRYYIPENTELNELLVRASGIWDFMKNIALKSITWIPLIPKQS